MGKKNPVRIHRLEYIRINDKLREVIVRVDDTTCKYADGWDDARVARELKLPLNSVGNLRREAYGNLPNTGNRSDNSRLKSDVEGMLKLLEDERAARVELQQTLSDQQTMILNMANTIEKLARSGDDGNTRLSKLIASLVIKGYHDLRHLEGPKQ
ncbi:MULTISPECIES: hypothetical protein [Bradyrhizobium]|uniref:hypothetical protein n=1 Tax=Bradyrhizobium TaxID=374 RepID=UPI00041500A7|nr:MULTISPECIES: hypothetical protein [Bradyrhizobium]WLB92422.1 hypothetical protein QIH91_20185 [Bradyrhizobium japonicum USDA 135]